VVEEATPEATGGSGGPGPGLERRFADLTRRIVAALEAVGVAAAVGELPGEYCPGRHSIHGGGVKLVGTAQRVIRGAALTSAVIVVTGGPRVREAVAATYDALGIPVDPALAGAVDEVAPGVTAERVREAVVAAYALDRVLDPAAVDDALAEATHALVAQHTPPAA
jgi:hypothetical protein